MIGLLKNTTLKMNIPVHIHRLMSWGGTGVYNRKARRSEIVGPWTNLCIILSDFYICTMEVTVPSSQIYCKAQYVAHKRFCEIQGKINSITHELNNLLAFQKYGSICFLFPYTNPKTSQSRRSYFHYLQNMVIKRKHIYIYWAPTMWQEQYEVFELYFNI